jgi:hypothetical protein
MFMKVFSLLLVCILCVLSAAFGQAKKEYCMINMADVGLSKERIVVDVDYGDDTEATRASKNNYIKDENGKNKEFYSTAQVLNWFGNQGWALKAAFVGTKTKGLGVQVPVYYYTFERDKKE